MKYDCTLSSDAFPSQEFDFMLSNPSYGKSWKTDLERLGSKGDIKDPRFVTQHGGNPEYKMIIRSSDGQLMFLVNKLSKMKHTTRLGNRIAEVHNGSLLFTGDAGQGESNIRRWIIENDWLEAIIALPQNLLYNTGIATYIWVLINRKSEERRGKVQHIGLPRRSLDAVLELLNENDIRPELQDKKSTSPSCSRCHAATI
jgi:type I restriction enzyme M protein